MNVPYDVRLFCLSFACFTLIHLLLSVSVMSCAPALSRRAHRLSPSIAANVCFTARILPTSVALFLVLALCIPSYLKWEPLSTAEPLGPLCLLSAVFGLSLWSCSLFRAASAGFATFSFSRNWGREHRLGPQVALAGILNPRITISDEVRRTLTLEQLEVVVRHENAHRSNRDNLKRLLLFLTPGLLPFSNGFRQVERSWAKFAEWAADDTAAITSEDSLTLAGALVSVARLQLVGPSQPVLWTSFLPGEDDLPARVERLLMRAAKPAPVRSNFTFSGIVGTIAFSVCLLFWAINASFLHAVHRLLEILIH